LTAESDFGKLGGDWNGEGIVVREPWRLINSFAVEIQDKDVSS
jgi:hypothetical protein